MLPDFFHKTFIFGKNSFINTTLVDEHTGEPVYEIQSSFSVQSTKTRVIRNSSDVVIITRREWPRSDSIAFQGHTEVKMKKWLNDNSFRDPQNISDTTAVRYIWKNEKFGELTLYRMDMPDGNFPLAAFHFIDQSTRSPTLRLTREAEYIQDAAIASLIYIAHTMRTRSENQAMSSSSVSNSLRMQSTMNSIF